MRFARLASTSGSSRRARWRQMMSSAPRAFRRPSACDPLAHELCPPRRAGDPRSLVRSSSHAARVHGLLPPRRAHRLERPWHRPRRRVRWRQHYAGPPFAGERGIARHAAAFPGRGRAPPAHGPRRHCRQLPPDRSPPGRCQTPPDRDPRHSDQRLPRSDRHLPRSDHPPTRSVRRAREHPRAAIRRRSTLAPRSARHGRRGSSERPIFPLHLRVREAHKHSRLLLNRCLAFASSEFIGVAR